MLEMIIIKWLIWLVMVGAGSYLVVLVGKATGTKIEAYSFMDGVIYKVAFGLFFYLSIQMSPSL